MCRLVWKVYGFSILMLVVAITPYVNILYSGHGGIAWFILPFSFPYAIVRMIIGYRKEKLIYLQFIKFSIPIYMVCSLPISLMASYSIEKSLGLSVNYLDFFMIMLTPFSLPYFFL